MSNEQDKQHLQELSAYRFTVDNLRALVAELEAQLAESTHPTQQGLDAQQLHSDIMNIQAGKHIGLSYREGHRDARHAAAALVLAAQANGGGAA